MASERAIKQTMYKLYGKKCMLCGHKIKRSNTKKKCKNPLTYHHIIEKSNGGETTVNNGAILCRKCHDWFNTQDSGTQYKLNMYFQKYKKENLKYKR